MIGPLKTFAALPNSHKAIFLKIGLVVPVVEASIKVLGFKRTYGILNKIKRKNPVTSVNPHAVINVHKILINLFAKRFSLFGKCLAHSLTLWFLFQNKGINTELKFGMKKENETLLAHAWLEYEGTPIAGEKELEDKYTFFPDSIFSRLS